MVKTERFVQIPIQSIAQLREWLQEHHTQKESIWLLLYKKSFGQYYIPKIEIIDELLCFGWLDGMARKLDEHTYLLLVSPRRIEHWSESYKRRIPKLILENRMAEAGLLAVEQSKKNGSWDYMNDVDQLIKPQDFLESLKKNLLALENFDAFGASSKRYMLRYIKIARSKKTRAKRIDLISSLAMQNQKMPGS